MSQPGNPERDGTTLRGFLARILGWSDEHKVAIEHALRSIDLGVTHRAALVLLGDTTELVSIAEALHRRTLGAECPFVVCDRKRADCESAVAAVQAARGGSLCMRHAWPPRDFSSMVTMVRDPGASVQFIVCGGVGHADDPFLTLPVPIQVPPLAAREDELPRIVDELARDAIATLGAFESDFTDADRGWVVGHGAADVELDGAELHAEPR
ncbi:MAG TPA: hypothetical protein VNO30_37305 [Kofleriaceae bacterium]|nr:hypothetical protein [Kofleriaceae bacterium]